MPRSQFRSFLTHRVELGGEWSKGMRTQTLLSGSAVALHYEPGPLGVSDAPHSLLRNRERSFPTPMGPAARRENVEAQWCAGRGLKTRGGGVGGWGGRDLKEESHALVHTLTTKKGHF